MFHDLLSGTWDFQVHMRPRCAPRAREAQPQKDIFGHWKIVHNACNIQLIIFVQQTMLLGKLNHSTSNGGFSGNITQLGHGTAANFH